MSIDNPPYGMAQDHEFGHDFNYAAWTPNSQISFHNVPWNNDYRDIVYYPTQSALDAYLNTVKGPSYTDASYLKASEPIIVGLPFNQCYKYNYLRATNPAQPIGSGDEARTFYYFITDVKYMSPQATMITVQLDVWQTFSRHVNFGRCYIERGHIGIANVNQFDDHGRKYLTVPEGLDVGNEYIVTDHMEHTIAKGSTEDFNVLIMSSVSLHDDPGTLANPTLISAKGSFYEKLPNGYEIYLCPSLDAFAGFMEEVSQYSWISQGIQSIAIVPNIWTTVHGQSPSNLISNIYGAGLLRVMDGTAIASLVKIADNWRSKISLPSRYRHLLKFKTYPYSVLEMTSYTGTPVVLKPEALGTDDLYVGQAMHIVPPNSRIIFYPFKYNGKEYSSDAAALDDVSSDVLPNDYAEYLDVTTGIFNLPQFSLVNDGYLGYMASNAHRVAFSYQNADWSQQRAMIAANGQFNMADTTLRNQYDAMRAERAGMLAQTYNSNVAKMGQAGIGAVNGLANAGLNGVSGNIGGAASQIVGTAAGAAQAMQGSIADMTNAISQSMVMTQVGGLQRSSAENARDTNMSMASQAARGDYANEIASINARVQDAHLIQPSTSGQLGGDAFNIAMSKWGVFFRVKTLQSATQAAIGEFWLRYGYAINRFGKMPANFKVMEKFTYWKLRETYITSSTCPETFKQSIRGIFEKGVTVWTNPADIGNIDIANNAPLTGVTL